MLFSAPTVWLVMLESNLGCRNLWLRQSTDTGIEGESQETDSKCGVSVKEVGTHRYTHTNAQTKKTNYASCIRHQSRSSSSSSTWTEPPSLSAVRCDPRVSLLVTGVG